MAEPNVQQLIEFLESSCDSVTRNWFLRATRGQRLRKMRDYHLMRALYCINQQPAWKDCAALAREIVRFENRTWPRIKNLSVPPATFSELQKFLFQAFKTEATVMPSTAVGLHEIYKKNRMRKFVDSSLSLMTDHN